MPFWLQLLLAKAKTSYYDDAIVYAIPGSKFDLIFISQVRESAITIDLYPDRLIYTIDLWHGEIGISLSEVGDGIEEMKFSLNASYKEFYNRLEALDKIAKSTWGNE